MFLNTFKRVSPLKYMYFNTSDSKYMYKQRR